MVTPFLLGSLLVLACVVHPLYSAKESCSDRCGESYDRGHSCHCDYDCLIHNECCKDYESMCTTSDSCKGRCGESFKRGRACSCDFDCTLYSQCCPDYQRHCGTEPQTSKLINEADVTVAHTQSSPGENEDIKQDLSGDHLIPLSTSPSHVMPEDEIQGDEGVGQTPYRVPVPAFGGVGPSATLYPDSMSGQEPLVISTTEDMLSSGGAYAPLHSTGMPTLWSEQEATQEEISTLFPEDLLLTQSSTVTPPVTDGTDVSTSVPSSEPPVEITSVSNSSSPAPELQSDSATNWSSITVSELTNPSVTPTREHDVLSPESTEPTTRIPQEPQATATTPEAGTAATPDTAEYSPSASQSSDQPVPTNKPTLGPTDSGPSTSRDETPAVTPVPSLSPDGVKGAGDASSTSPSGTPDQSGTSVTPPLTGTAAQTDSSSPATATEADTSLAGDDITNAAKTGGPTPTDEAKNIETQPAPSSDPTTASMRSNPSSLQPSKKPTRPSTLTVIAQTLATGNPNDYLPVSNSSSPAPELQSDSATNWSSITVSELTNPSVTPTREHDVLSPESTEPTTRIPQEPQATATTPEAGTAATPDTAEYSPSASQSSDQPVPTNKPTFGPTDSGPSTSRDKTPAVTPVPSPSPDGVKGARDASSTSPSGTPDQSGTSVTPPLTGTAAQTDSSSPATATEADTSLAGDDITNAAKTGGPTPTDEAKNIETQPAPSSDPTTASMRPNPSSLQPSKKPTRPSTLTVIAQTLATGNPNDYLPVDNNDTNLCSGRPISGLTTLQNGTIVVFRGNYFWVLDANRSPGPAHSITGTWGIPSPIDTVFTRCHCDAKTYFMKGNNYWRFGNGVMDQGYPKPITLGFDKLAGTITAALSVPATRMRRESVYFFKRGGLVQKYTYKPNSACSRKVPKKVYLVRTRFTRQTASAEPSLGKEINIKLKWRGFPTLVTSAVSIPSHRQPDGYNYYIFSRTKYYKIKLDNEQPALANPPTVPSQQNSANNWFKCP